MLTYLLIFIIKSGLKDLFSFSLIGWLKPLTTWEGFKHSSSNSLVEPLSGSEESWLPKHNSLNSLCFLSVGVGVKSRNSSLMILHLYSFRIIDLSFLIYLFLSTAIPNTKAWIFLNLSKIWFVLCISSRKLRGASPSSLVNHGCLRAREQWYLREGLISHNFSNKHNHLSE